MSEWSISRLLSSLHDDISRRLATVRETLAHPGTKGDASERVWLELLQKYLPKRYQAEKAHVVDSQGVFSEQIDIVIFDREVIELITAETHKAIPIPGDLREESYCKELVARTVEALGGLDIVVSNAGRQQQCEDILQLSSEAFDATMKTNIYAPFWIIKAALPHLNTGSCIIATTSQQAYDPAGNLYDYAQTKAATMNYVKSLSKQFGPKGIRVNGVAPGPIWTPLQVSGGATQEHLMHFGETYPLRRAGQPAELASIYVQLAANDASYTTGNIYGASGGGGQP